MTAYYNDFDPQVCAWLEELVRRGLIAPGDVDRRSILDVRPDDLRGYTQCHFFAGIGGWAYALRLAGWPDDKPVWTGSPPCQPFSSAGQRKGKDDDRHLAPHFVELVRACRPDVLFGEQVASADVFGKAASGSRKAPVGTPQWAWLDDLSDRLEAARYAVGASDIPSAGVGAPHIRQRTFFGAVRLADSPEGGVGNPAHFYGRNRAEARGLDGSQRAIYSQAWQGDGQAFGVTGGAVRLADTNEQQRDGCGNAGARGRAEASIGGASVGMAHAPASGRREERAVSGGVGEGDGTQRRPARHDAGGDLGGMANACADGSQRGLPGRQDAGREAVNGSSGRDGATRRPRTPDSPWRDADWLFCRDGKWRPVEPRTFPLADRVPARVGRLRGYGNAINPWCAKVFIEAFQETALDLRLNTLSDLTDDKGDIFS